MDLSATLVGLNVDVGGGWYERRALALYKFALSSFDFRTSALFLLSMFSHNPIFLLAGTKLVSTPPTVLGLRVSGSSG